MSKYDVYVDGVSLEAVFNKLGGTQGAKRFLAGELILTEAPTTLRPVESLTIRIPALARMDKKAICEKYGFQRVEKDDSPEGETILTLTTVLKTDENSVSGSVYETRLQVVQGQLGLSQALWLVDHQDEFPELMALLGKVYIDFPATIAVSLGGSRSVPCLVQGGSRWGLDWVWLAGGFGSRGRVARSRK